LIEGAAKGHFCPKVVAKVWDVQPCSSLLGGNRGGQMAILAALLFHPGK